MGACWRSPFANPVPQAEVMFWLGGLAAQTGQPGLDCELPKHLVELSDDNYA